MDNKKELKRRIGVTIFLMLAAVGIWVYSYLTEYYEAEPEALEVLEEGKDTGTIYASASDSENLILKADGETDTGIVFYPGGKVEYTAYLPLLEQLREQGYDIVLVKMPFNLAFFDMNAAEDVLDNMDEELPEVKNWYIMGHSLGGVAASSFAADESDSIAGLILLGAYDYGKYDESNTLIVYGSNDVKLDLDKVHEDKSEVVEIDGGNHAWFGNYGEQDGDGEATISHQEQQDITTETISQWLS